MKVEQLRVFKTHKSGSLPEEYEDAVAISKDKLHIAISDGATEASFSKAWAEILVKNYIVNPTEVINSEWLSGPFKAFNDLIQPLDLPWYSRMKIDEEGSFATLLGLSIDSESKRFVSIALGDSCMFWKDDGGEHSFPISCVNDFNNSPYLISNQDMKNRQSYPLQELGNWDIGKGVTTIFLMTDAMAHWFMLEYTKGNKPWEYLIPLKSKDRFVKFIGELRDKKLIRNDDCTLVILKIINDMG